MDDFDRIVSGIDEAFRQGKRTTVRRFYDETEDLDPGWASEIWLSSLESWRVHDPDGKYGVEARRAAVSYAELAGDAALETLYPYWVEILNRGGRIKDWSLFAALAKRSGQPEVLDEPEVGDAIRKELPDVWVKRALARGAYDEAVACFFEKEGHWRLRLAAPALLKQCDADDVDVIVACRLSLVEYHVLRSGRSRYRRACKELKTLREQLTQADASEVWHYVMDDVRMRWARRPALLEELSKAGL